LLYDIYITVTHNSEVMPFSPRVCLSIPAHASSPILVHGYELNFVSAGAEFSAWFLLRTLHCVVFSFI